MKLLCLSIICILFSQLSFGQVALNTARKLIKDEAKLNSPQFTNDNSNSSNATSYLFNEVAPSGYDLFSANLSFSEKDQVQKIGFSPVRLAGKYIPVLANLRFNVVNNAGALTTGVSIGQDYSVYETKRVQKIFSDVYKDGNLSTNALMVSRARDSEETMAEYMEWYKVSDTKILQDRLLEEFDARRLRHVIKWSIGYNSQFFPILKSKSVDGSFDSLNYHGFKGHNLLANLNYSYKNGFINLSGSGNYFSKRKSADSLQRRRDYVGTSLGASIRVLRLISNTKLKEKDFYRKSLFIPSIYLGASYERQTYKGKESEFAENKQKWVSVTAFYIDVAISPISQFRLSFPIQHSREFDSSKSDASLVTVLQYNLKLINLN